MESNEEGELHVITGTMYGGKTTDAWNKIQQHLRKKRVLALKPESSFRKLEQHLKESSGKIYVTTHNGLTISCDNHPNLKIMACTTHLDLSKEGLLSKRGSLNPMYTYNIIWIDEAHFYDYDDLKKLLSLALYRFKKIVYISMLDSFTHNTPIPHMKLFNPCTSRIDLKTYCKSQTCNNIGLVHVYSEKQREWEENDPPKMSMKDWVFMFHNKKVFDVDNDTSKVKVGSDDDYSVLC